MSNNCSLSVKKFKDFNYVDSNLFETASNANNEYNHGNLAQNDILLVGYRYKNMTDCPEIKIPLNVITAASSPQSIYFQVDNSTNELQYTYNDPTNSINPNWHNTGVIIPNGCNCDQNETPGLYLYFDESNGDLYYSQNEIDSANLTGVEHVHINVNSSGGGSTGGDPVVSIDHIDSEHNDNNRLTTVTIVLTNGNEPSFDIPDGQDGAIPQFQINPQTQNIEYSYDNTHWTSIGQAVIQQGGTTTNNTFAFNIQQNRNDCVNAGDAYIELDQTDQNYGHLLVFTGTNFRDCGRIVGTNGTNGAPRASVGQLVYTPSNNIDSSNIGYNGSINATSQFSINGGDINCYDLQDSGGNSLGYIYVANGADGINGKSVDSLDCTTSNTTPNSTPNNFDPTSGAVNQYTLYDNDGNILGDVFVKNGVDGTNASSSGQTSITFGTVTVNTNNVTQAEGRFEEDSNNPGVYNLSLNIPVINGQDGQDGQNGQNGQNGTTMQLYKLVASDISATPLSNGSYYRINSSSPIWSKYNPTNGTFEQLTQNPDFTGANFVEVCPADTTISDVINNLTYGTCGMYTSNTLSFYAVKDPTEAGTLCFTIKAYYNIQP